MLDRIAKWLDEVGRTWRLDSQSVYTPDADDVRAALDAAAGKLYSEPVGARLTSAGLIVEKLDHGFDVYVHAGIYE